MVTQQKNALIISVIIFSAILTIFAYLAIYKKTDLPANSVSFQALSDSDGDGLYDIEEDKFYKTDPAKPDTDDDELGDLDEVAVYFTDPNKKYINPDTGLTDKQTIDAGYNPITAEPLTDEEKEALTRRLEQLKIKFPDEYILLENEVPEGFRLKPVSEAEASRYGATGNPGFYDLQDETLENLTFGYIYVKPDAPETELGVFVIKYYFPDEVSDEELEREWRKIYSTNPRILLRRGNTLIYLWADTLDYSPDMRIVADRLKQRLSLTEL